MEFEEYVAARYGRLLEHAVELGCPADQAPGTVGRVLKAHRRAIERSEDPDPEVREALARDLTGEPDRTGVRRSVAVAGVLALVVIAAGVLVAAKVLVDPPPGPVPSFFGYDGDTARETLEGEGYLVEIQEVRACEPKGLVVSTDPPAGVARERGTTVQVRTAVPSNADCLASYGFRSDAWEFVRYVRGGPAPDLTDRVTVLLDGVRTEVSDRGIATDLLLRGVLAPVRLALARPARTPTGMPRLNVRNGIRPRVCGPALPPEYSARWALRLEVDASPEGRVDPCPLTIDLFRSGERLEALVVSSGS